MWLCTKLGFYSVVQKAPDEFHVRARAEQDLVNLKRAAKIRAKILRTAPADYRFRMILNGTAWRICGAVLIDSIDYSNFKSMIAASGAQHEKLHVYSTFHHDMELWQEVEDAEPSWLDA